MQIGSLMNYCDGKEGWDINKSKQQQTTYDFISSIEMNRKVMLTEKLKEKSPFCLDTK